MYMYIISRLIVKNFQKLPPIDLKFRQMVSVVPGKVFIGSGPGTLLFEKKKIF